MSYHEKICFSSADFDRQSLKRGDTHWITEKLHHPQSNFLLFWNNKFLAHDDLTIKLLDKSSAEKFNSQPLVWNFIGQLTNDNVKDATSNNIIFCAEIDQPTPIVETTHWKSLRSLGAHQSPQHANMLSYTQGLLNWHSNNQFCTQCGSSVITDSGGNALRCTNNDCSKELFPRIDPAVIVLVVHQDSCLLGRAKSWPEGMYSCLAGFVETGEDLESAVRRECFEEAGIELTNIVYRGSQPWPFPQSLMVGFHAKAKNKELTFHDGEIEDAQWYSRQQILEAVKKGELKISSSLSISYHLLEDWFNLESDSPLSQLLNI
jgi:NAD+ diphosphatase